MYRRLSASPSPFTRPPAPTTPSPAAAAAATPTDSLDRNPNLMLVSPDEAFGAAAKRALSDAGFSVMLASDSISAIGLLRGCEIDGLITTIRMPRGHPHGVALARLVRDHKSATPVILLTNSEGFRAGEPGFLEGLAAILCPLGDVAGLVRRAQLGMGGSGEGGPA
ncbi:MAG TPA: response regulator [Alphaproteobacteria bacterium]